MRRTSRPDARRPRVVARAAVPRPPAARRVAAWGLAALVATGAGLGWLALSAERSLARGRERLLAGDAAAAQEALGSVHWPGAWRRAAAGRALARAASGFVPGGAAGAPAPLALGDLAFFEPEALLLRALEQRELKTAKALAEVLGTSGHSLGPLYQAALLFDAGEDEAARRMAAASPVPLAARGLGARLERALAIRAGTSEPLVLDRSGEPVATRQRDGVLRPLATGTPEVAELLARINALGAPRSDAPRAVRLSVDLELSRVALEALGPRQGSIVLLDPRSGAVRAAVSDAVTARTEPSAAFEQRREPASIAKLITTAAAYRASHDADALIREMRCTGVERYGGQPLWCPWPAGPLAGLDHALAVSCNVAFANLAMRIGRERLVEEYRRWGFDAGPEALLAAAGRIGTQPELPRQLADLAIGLELSEITPLHAAALAAIVANGGRLAEPRLVSGGCGALGLEDAPDPLPPSRYVIDQSVAARLEQAMRAVVQYGTGSGLEPPGLPLAMKTGTAATPRIGYHVNYVGFVPAREPALAFCVRVTGRRSPRAIHADAREVAGRLFAGLASRLASERRAPPRTPEPALAPAR